jgi:cyclohexanone monooxygenase
MQSGQSANFQHMLDVKSQHIAYVLSEAKARGVKALEPSAEAEKDWVDTIVKLAVGRRAFLSECTPGYYNNEGGALDLRVAKNNQYWRGPMVYVRQLDRWRADGTLPGLELTL